MSDRPSPKDVPLEQLIDELWPYHQPPAGFAARVLSAHRARGVPPDERQRPRPRRPLLLWLGGTAVAIAAAAVLLLARMGGEGERTVVRGDGQLRADDRQTVRLDQGALAVAEKGSEIAWSMRRDGMRVDQPRGDVFYRVDKGTPFLVVTPAGEVEVTGTCFRVVVDQVAGGRLTARMRVEVSEGAVKARSGPSEVILRAGEEARLQPDQLPLRTDRAGGGWQAAAVAVGASPTELRALERSSRMRALDAEARVRQLERALAQQTVAQQPRAAGMPPRRKLFGFTPEERVALARRCDFRWGLPKHLTQWTNPRYDRSLLLDASESAAVGRVMEEQRIEFVEQLRSIYLEVVGDQQAVQTLSPMALHHEIGSKSRSADGKEARQTILMEWAGRRQPPADASKRPPMDRFWRLMTSASDDFVTRLQPILGPERARELTVGLVDLSVWGREPNCPSGEKSPPEKSAP
jgi:hypothetical protein